MNKAVILMSSEMEFSNSWNQTEPIWQVQVDTVLNPLLKVYGPLAGDIIANEGLTEPISVVAVIG